MFFLISIWSLYFNCLNSLQDEFLDEHASKLEGFKRVFKLVCEDPLQGLTIIDAIQRLGIDHHFQHEIEQVLQRQFMLSASGNGFNNYDLHEVALRFRLLRQEGYFVPAGLKISILGLKFFSFLLTIETL